MKEKGVPGLTSKQVGKKRNTLPVDRQRCWKRFKSGEAIAVYK